MSMVDEGQVEIELHDDPYHDNQNKKQKDDMSLVGTDSDQITFDVDEGSAKKPKTSLTKQ